MNTKKNPLDRLMYGISFLFDFIYRILEEYSKIVMLVIVLIVSAQVICRKFLGFSISWSDEVALLLMVWMAFISMAIGVEKKLHIAIEMFFKKFPAPIQKILNVINSLVTVLFGVTLIVYGVRMTQASMGSILPATGWPGGTLYIMIPVSGVFICYYALIDLFHLERFRHRELEEGFQKEENT
ncbi:TRAP transporter small permease [Caproicibacter fermentans]|uniref:TRAP transporter small permease n=1 Tax=Caproicibacter fermentans TaxID=2576756 RepID=A0A7G8TEC6_9FIRM|nr:TRAP transporter small permease [Caproicibacter fermentans]QNK41967.1 TRAP transporter small permease [Caproicibacter fermentans]